MDAVMIQVMSIGALLPATGGAVLLFSISRAVYRAFKPQRLTEVWGKHL
jgi:hypothetical protein